MKEETGSEITLSVYIILQKNRNLQLDYPFKLSQIYLKTMPISLKEMKLRHTFKKLFCNSLNKLIHAFYNDVFYLIYSFL